MYPKQADRVKKLQEEKVSRPFYVSILSASSS